MSESSVTIEYFSDLLCIWAYVGQVRLDELRRTFGARVKLEQRWVPVFGSTSTKIGEGWSTRGGFEGYAGHVRKIAARFDHAEVHPEVWTRCIPAGSLAAHQLVKAASLASENAGGGADAGSRPPMEELAWRLRLAFFRDLRDIACMEVQLDVARQMALPVDAIRSRIEDGSALAALAEDHELASRHGIQGSPTLLINEGRQKLYGNVGYRVIEANVEELLRDNTDKASWC